MTKLSYSVQDAADMIGCSPAMVDQIIASNNLPAFTMSDKPRAKRFIRHDDLVAYINFRAENAA